MSKKKLAGIVAVCVIAVIVVVVIATRPTPTYTLSVSVSPSGAGSVSPSGGEYESGVQVTLTASPASSYQFASWSGDASGANLTATITMNSNKNVIATFELIRTNLTDPTDDLFDVSANPITDLPYLDIVEAEVTTSGSDYIARITLNASLPTQTPDPQIFLEWDIYVDADGNSSTGSVWPLIINDLGSEYFARLMLLDSNYSAEVRNLETGEFQSIQYTITNNIIELRWSQEFYQTDTFNFVVAAKKYGERGAGSAFMLADKAPNQGHGQFP
jgi:hypothetical protein